VVEGIALSRVGGNVAVDGWRVRFHSCGTEVSITDRGWGGRRLIRRLEHCHRVA
jgi:hypothetical protein